MNKKLKLGLVAIIAALALALAGCTGSNTSGATGGSSANGTGTAEAGSTDVSTEDLQKVSFVLDYSPNVNHTGIYVALAKGWFAEEGLNVEIVPVPADGADALIGSGGANMGITYQDSIANSLGSANPLPYTAVAAVVQHNTSGIMSRAEDGITSPAAMVGHRYATWNLPTEQATIKHLVESEGANFSDVELVPYEVEDDVMGLQANLYDAVWVYEWWAVANANLQGYPVNYFAFGDMDPVFDFYTPVIAVNDAFAEDNPEAVRAFLRAVKRGYEFAAENPREAAGILCEEVPELDRELIQEAQNILSPQYIADATSWGEIDAERWAAYYTWINENGLAENAFDANAGYTLEYLGE